MTILNAEYHAPLIRDLDFVCQTSRIPEKYITTSMVNFCGEQEVQWFKELPNDFTHQCGLLFVGSDKPIIDRMLGIGGAFIRHYIDAKFLMLNHTLQVLKEEPSGIANRVVLMPNFHTPKEHGGYISQWELPRLIEMVYSRSYGDQLTVLYTPDLATLKTDYGLELSNFLVDKYIIIKQ